MVNVIKRRSQWTAVAATLLVGLSCWGTGIAAAAAPPAVTPTSPVAPAAPPAAALVDGPGDARAAADPLLGIDLDLDLFPPMDLIDWNSVFVPWGDERLYTLVAGGDAESGADWDFTGGGFFAYGNEPWRVWGSTDRRSATLLRGASGTLRTTDYFAAELRFFVQRLSGSSSSSSLKVTVTAQNADGTTETVTHQVDGTSQWAPSPPLDVPDLRGTDGVQYLTIRFETVGRGTWRLDDVALDPWRSG